MIVHRIAAILEQLRCAIHHPSHPSTSALSWLCYVGSGASHEQCEDMKEEILNKDGSTSVEVHLHPHLEPLASKMLSGLMPYNHCACIRLHPTLLTRQQCGRLSALRPVMRMSILG